MAEITREDRDYAEDMGHEICEKCGTAYIPVDSFENEGHSCPDVKSQPQE